MKMIEPKKHIPATLLAIVMDVIDDMPLDARVGIANLEEDEIRILELTLGKYLQYRLDSLPESAKRDLADDCKSLAGSPTEIDEAQTILRYVWKILRDTHRLKAVK